MSSQHGELTLKACLLPPSLQVADGSWHLFDDKLVQPWSLDRLDEDCFGGASSSPAAGDRPNSAYMLFYERKDAACFDAAGARGPIGHLHSQQQQQQAGPSDSTGDPHRHDVPSTPYGMPVEVFEGVLRQGLVLMHKLHVGEEGYALFIRHLVEGRCEEGKASHKIRRRLLPAAPAASASSGDATLQQTPELSLDHEAVLELPSPSRRVVDQDAACSQGMHLAAQFMCAVLVGYPAASWLAFPAWDTVLELSKRGPGPCMALLRAVANFSAPNSLCKLLNDQRSGPQVLHAIYDAFRYRVVYNFHGCVGSFLGMLGFVWENCADARNQPMSLCLFRRCLVGPGEQASTAASSSRQELITLEADMFRKLETIASNTQRSRASQLYDYPGQLKPVYSLMASMLRMKLGGAWQVLSSGLATTTAVQLVRDFVDFQQDECVSDSIDDVAAICNFLYAHLQLVHASQLSVILPFQAGPQASYPNPWLGLARSAGEALFLQPQLIQLLVKPFQEQPFLSAILMEPELLEHPEVCGLLKGLCWQNGPLSATLNTSVFSVVRLEQLQEDYGFALLGQHFVDMLSSLKDSFYEQRILHAIHGDANHPGLVSILGCVKPLPRLFGWWCVLSLAQLLEKVSTKLSEFLSQHPQVHQMHKFAASNQGLVGIDPGIRQMYYDVQGFISRMFGVTPP